MVSLRIAMLAGLIPSLLLYPPTLGQQPVGQTGLAGQAAAPLPEIRQLMREVQEHQKQLEKVRENYTFTSLETTQDIDGSGQVKKTETEEYEEFYVNGHPIGRLVKKDGKPLDDHDRQKENYFHGTVYSIGRHSGQNLSVLPDSHQARPFCASVRCLSHAAPLRVLAIQRRLHDV